MNNQTESEVSKAAEDRCRKCGHSDGVNERGQCVHLLAVGLPSPNARWEELHCGCHCEFSSQATAAQDAPKIDFSCRVCGVQCAIAPDPPAHAICPEHCEDHDYRYERELRGHFCFHCGQEAPQDWGDD